MSEFTITITLWHLIGFALGLFLSPIMLNYCKSFIDCNRQRKWRKRQAVR